MSFFSMNLQYYYRFAELSKLLQRFLISNIKVILLIAALIVLVGYIQSLHRNAAFENGWTLSNSLDDSLDRQQSNLQYAVIIDAGSSGSRVYIYVWPPHSGDTRQLLKVRLLHDKLGKNVQFSITPGLSACASHPLNASDYIEPLLTFAADHVPKEKHKETPLYILATAGMRLIDKATQENILNDLRKDIPKSFLFQFAPNNVQVISGQEEGVYSWISINYLMNRFDHTFVKAPLIEVENDRTRLKRMSTISMIEMGGASVQVAFEITSNEQYKLLKSKFNNEANFKNMISEFNLGCSEHDTDHQYRLFVTTFLTLGANSARKMYSQYLIDDWDRQNLINTTLATKETALFDPCLSIDSSETINITRKNNFENVSTQYLYHLKGSGDYELCSKKVKQIITQDALSVCNNETCPFADLSRVSVPFSTTDFYGLSEFWYTMNDVFFMGGYYHYSKFNEASTKFCSTSYLVSQDRLRRKLYPNADSKRILYQCFKSAWVSSVLHDGFKMSKQYSNFKSVLTLNEEPVQWTLGALIFRTRFFPLRTIDNQHGVQVHHALSSWTGNNYFQYVLFALCMLAVILFICVYLRRLHMMVNENKPYYTKINEIESFPLCEEHLESSLDGASLHSFVASSSERKNKNVFIDMNFS